MPDLFAFSGRLNRKPYWLIVLGSTVSVIAASAVIFLVVALASPDSLDSLDTFLRSPAALAAGVLVLLLYLVLLAVSLAASSRRLHDRGKSAWWLLLFYGVPAGIDLLMAPLGAEAGIAGSGIAAIVSIWALVELGFLRGTPGPNRFGPDPLAGR